MYTFNIHFLYYKSIVQMRLMNVDESIAQGRGFKSLPIKLLPSPYYFDFDNLVHNLVNI